MTTLIPHTQSSHSAEKASYCHVINSNHAQEMPTPALHSPSAYAEIIEQPASVGARFRYKCEGRSAGCIRGANNTDKQKSYPTIKVHGYQGAAGVVVSCVTKDGPPYYPHPHNLVGKTCTNGVCYKPINNSDMTCSFPNLGIQCVKKKEIIQSLMKRKELQVDPYGTGFRHVEPNKINLNVLRLCFQVIIADSNGKLSVPLGPVISSCIFDNKTVSDLTISKLSHSSAPVTGGQEIILLCDQVNKDDIQVIFYEESAGKISWSAQGKFTPHHVHRKVAIWFTTPAYNNQNVQEPISCFIQLRRPSDGAIGKSRSFTLQPVKDPEALSRKRSKYEALQLDQILHRVETESDTEPRVIRHAVRIKASLLNKFTPGKEENQIPDDISSLPNQKLSHRMNFNLPEQSTSNVQPPSPNRHKVEDLLAIATEQIGISAAATFCETPSDINLEKLSSLDLGFDPCDLDVNLSGITLDSFSDTSGMNISASAIEMRSSDKFQFGDKACKQDKPS